MTDCDVAKQELWELSYILQKNNPNMDFDDRDWDESVFFMLMLKDSIHLFSKTLCLIYFFN